MSDTMAQPDLTFPPNPFAHGPCAAPDCPNPAVFEGGLCATHIEVPKPAGANVAPAAPALPWSAKDWAARKKQRRVAAASARRNRR